MFTKKLISPRYLFLVFIGSVFFVEALIMLVLNSLPPMSELNEALIDASALAILTFPLLYFFIFLPQNKLAKTLIDIRSELLKKNEELEISNQQLALQNFETARHEQDLLRFAVGLDNLTTGVIIADNDRKLIYINPVAIKLFSNIESDIRKDLPKFSVIEMLGMNIDKYHKNPAYQAKLLENLTETVTINITMGARIVSITASPMIDEFGIRRGSLAEWLDITELTNSQRENEDLSLQLNHIQKVESIGRLTAGLAHDFNNILSCMLGYNEMNRDISAGMKNEVLKSELEDNTKQVELAGRRATALIEKMMAYCRQDTVKTKVDAQDTQRVISEVIEMLRPGLTSKIQVESEFECHDVIQIDAGDLHQILTNLAVNARDAMKKSGGNITISLKKAVKVQAHCVACATKIEGDFIELSVADNGTGINPNIVNRLFDPFFTTKEQGEGTGLGLSAVSGLVHNANGHILIYSNCNKPYQGTTFRLLFQNLTNHFTNQANDLSI